MYKNACPNGVTSRGMFPCRKQPSTGTGDAGDYLELFPPRSIEGSGVDQAGIGWLPGTGGRDDEARLGLLLEEGFGFEDLADFTEPSGRVRFAMRADVNEVFTEFLAVHVVLDSRYDLVLHLFSRTILDPAVFDDTHFLRFFVHHLEYPCPPSSWCVGLNVVE